MLSEYLQPEKVYIACGYTDLRRGIDGLAGLVQERFRMDPYTDTLYLFCGRRPDRIKALLWTVTDLYCCISGWIKARSNGPGALMKQDS